MSPIIADIEKNSREIVRIDVSEFKEKEYINIRIWFHDVDGQTKPTQKGIALNIEQYEELLKAVQRVGEYINDRKAE